MRMARGMDFAGILRFARRDSDDFDAHVTRNREREREPDSLPAKRKKAAVRGEVREPNRGRRPQADD